MTDDQLMAEIRKAHEHLYDLVGKAGQRGIEVDLSQWGEYRLTDQLPWAFVTEQTFRRKIG